jgi:hypothetical protein
MKFISVKVALVVLVMSVSSFANAGIININFEDTGFGVTVDGSGTFDTSGLTETFSDVIPPGLFINSLEGAFGFGDVANVDFFEAIIPVPFGTSSSIFTASAGTGDMFGIAFGGSAGIMLPINYISGDALAFTVNFIGESYASLGITATDTVAVTAGLNTINLNFSAVDVPAPSSIAILALGLIGLTIRRLKK